MTALFAFTPFLVLFVLLVAAWIRSRSPRETRQQRRKRERLRARKKRGALRRT